MFSDTANASDYITSNGMLFDDWWIREDVGGDDTILIRILHRHFSAGAEGTRQKSRRQDIRRWCLPFDSQAAYSVASVV
jgi:hypothetical protein